MTARALQSVVVRMHHDPSFVAAVYEDAERALLDEDLTAEERAMLTLPDRRAWGADRQRRDRVLEALRREYPVACALAELAASRQGLLAFFSSPQFHGCVRARGRLALAFGTWLRDQARAGRLGRTATAETARIERAAAEIRREPPHRPGRSPERLRASPHVRVLEAAAGTVELFSGVRAAIATSPPGEVLLPQGRLPRLDGGRPEYVVVERGAGTPAEVSVGTLPEPLFELVRAAGGGADRGELLALIGRYGLEGTDALDVLEDTVADGLLVPVDPPRAGAYSG